MLAKKTSLDQFEKTPFFFEGKKKDYIGELKRIRGIEEIRLTDVVGFYRTEDGYEAFVTDSILGNTVAKVQGETPADTLSALIWMQKRNDYESKCRELYNTIEVTKPTIINFLLAKGYKPIECETIYSRLAKDEWVLVELAYFIETGSFPPDAFACFRGGHTAETYILETNANPIEAFLFLVDAAHKEALS